MGGKAVRPETVREGELDKIFRYAPSVTKGTMTMIITPLHGDIHSDKKGEDGYAIFAFCLYDGFVYLITFSSLPTLMKAAMALSRCSFS